MSDDWYATPKQLANGHRTVHNDRDCCALSFADDVIVVDRADFTASEVCDACQRRDNDEAQCNGYHQQLAEMSPEEAFADD